MGWVFRLNIISGWIQVNLLLKQTVLLRYAKYVFSFILMRSSGNSQLILIIFYYQDYIFLDWFYGYWPITIKLIINCYYKCEDSHLYFLQQPQLYFTYTSFTIFLLLYVKILYIEVREQSQYDNKKWFLFLLIGNILYM